MYSSPLDTANNCWHGKFFCSVQELSHSCREMTNLLTTLLKRPATMMHRQRSSYSFHSVHIYSRNKQPEKRWAHKLTIPKPYIHYSKALASEDLLRLINRTCILKARLPSVHFWSPTLPTSWNTSVHSVDATYASSRLRLHILFSQPDISNKMCSSRCIYNKPNIEPAKYKCAESMLECF